MNRNIFLFITMFCCMVINAQDYFPKNDGVHTVNTNYIALTNAKIFVTPTEIIDNGTLLLKDDKVVASGKNVSIPKNTVIIDIRGKFIYPSFIDVYSSFGINQPKAGSDSSRSSQYNPSRTGYYWNDHVMPEQKAVTNYQYDSKQAEELLKAGFGIVNSHIHDGIVRGSGILLALNNKNGDQYRVLDDNSGQYFSFAKSVTSRQYYPSSIMGSMALIRQLYIDADWYGQGRVDTKDLSLEAFNKNKSLVQFFEAGSRQNIMRADKIGDENGVQYVMLGGGDEYERINDIKNTNATILLPLNFPVAFDVEDPFATESLTLSDLRAWNQKPFNPKILADNSVPFAFTMAKAESIEAFQKNLLKAIAAGLSEEKALEALTTIPAKLLGKSSEIGSLKNGSLANFMVSSGNIFEPNSVVNEHWIQGERLVFKPITTEDLKGSYQFKLADETYGLTINDSINKLKSRITKDGVLFGSKISFDGNWMNLTMRPEKDATKEFIRIVAQVDNNDNLTGKFFKPNGNESVFYAKRLEKVPEQDANKYTKKRPKVYSMTPVTYPNKAYGYETLPESETILFKNATVWTNEDEGILENTDVLVKDGKIAKIGKDLSNSRAQVIDATGKHLTAGIIDEHSHIATSSVNEGGQNSSAEVSIEDVIDEKSIGIYRDLAGGVTSIQILHGSANPIGGRSAIIKLKWGESAQNLIYDNSPKFIKFALGENVKQSNWGSRSRFPQSRMGVEQVFTDYFTRAKAYDVLKKSGKPYKRDIELDVLAEILNKERFISCHSYVQSEINMLMKVAEKFDFRVNTFTHILEGYKVADKMAEHGVGGSTFSDWWAYKYEVKDAIPYNAAIMHHAGVTVAINSDDAEMSRRLNQEAAKSVKYGGMTEEEAWKMVTLNPAKLLHIDDRVGSVKEGKDADLVLWSDNPLSIYAKAEKTLIEGATYFDLEKDQEMREAIKEERSALINEMMLDKNKGLKTKPISTEKEVHLHCDSMDSGI